MKLPKSERALRRIIKNASGASKIGSETKKSVTAVLLIACAALLILARIGKAGPVGDALFSLLDNLFGWGYYLVPGMALLVAILFFLAREKTFMGVTFLGAISAVVFGLGLIDLVFPDKGGWIGGFVGLLEAPFGKTAAIVLALAFIAISILIAFNASLRFRFPQRKTSVKLGEEEEAEIEEAYDEVEAETKKQKEEPEEDGEEETEDEVEPMIVEPATASKKDGKMIAPISHKDYVAPPASLLKSSTEKPTSGDIRANANIIKRTLDGFGIPVEMSEINIGPKVTRYTLKPAEGVKLAKIVALNQDLALALAAHPIRIEAPIPGKSLVGIEVPNKAAAIVRLGSLMGYPEFAGSGSLAFPLGRDVGGEPIFVDIEKLPHLLVAGSTGSGKSITIHSILISLLYKNSPETLRLILIDPKRVEFSTYEGIPHLVAPVITEAKKSVGVFRWAISEMERRYEILLKAGSRDIKSYNKNGGKDEPLPYLVIIVDEMADLMASYGREVEGSIVRLAQMARATGIHLIVSTQRPSVEVITGLIKANITGRIALQVASQIDSRTILDIAGAEKLLGGGDLLFVSSEFSKPKRIQGAYISEEELNGVTKFIKEHNDTLGPTEAGIEKEMGDMRAESNEVFDEFLDDNESDDLYDEAIEVIREAGKASASLLQRRLKVGYARAARLLDIMESRGVIGPGDGAKPREILIDNEPPTGN
jgi:S-DNA-T family DNA segregation ATPase FtsK/SpoIIIE